ncbi:MAG: S8 family peptidase [Actinomycetota bacterium]|nr:S8 family peptidase [Actinomycetota bacterium]
MAETHKRPSVILFKAKDQRPDKDSDKLDIVSAALTSEVTFVEAGTMARGAGLPTGVPGEAIGFDVNEYEAPIVTAALTDREISTLENDDNVEAVEEDGPMWALQRGHSTEGLNLGTDGLHIEGHADPAQETIPDGVYQVKALPAWDCSRGKAIKVAVLDTGIDGSHPDLAANYKGGVSFAADETSPMDINGHGTHCAGTIAAAINGAGVVGVAPAADLYAVKVLNRRGSGSFSQLIAGLDWCVKNKIRIASMSLGGTEAPTALERMCALAWKRGLLLVAAAGNAGPDSDTVTFPARYESVVGVSALAFSLVIAPFSSRGPEVELCAPGVSVMSTLPGGTYGYNSGTSMACPHVSGAAALAWGSHRYAKNVTIRRLLAWTSDNLGRPGRDVDYGFGRVDAEQAACELTMPPVIPGLP